MSASTIRKALERCPPRRWYSAGVSLPYHPSRWCGNRSWCRILCSLFQRIRKHLVRLANPRSARHPTPPCASKAYQGRKRSRRAPSGSPTKKIRPMISFGLISSIPCKQGIVSFFKTETSSAPLKTLLYFLTPPMRDILVPQSGQVPLVITRPFLVTPS